MLVPLKIMPDLVSCFADNHLFIKQKKKDKICVFLPKKEWRVSVTDRINNVASTLMMTQGCKRKKKNPYCLNSLDSWYVFSWYFGLLSSSGTIPIIPFAHSQCWEGRCIVGRTSDYAYCFLVYHHTGTCVF